MNSVQIQIGINFYTSITFIWSYFCKKLQTVSLKVLAAQKLTFSQITVQTGQHSALFITQDFWKLAFACLFAGRAEQPAVLQHFPTSILRLP